MQRGMKRNLAAGAAGLAIVAGAGGAYAATRTSGDNERQAFLDDAAKRLNISPQKLAGALQDAFFARLDAAVSAGRLSKAQADRIKQRVEQGGGLPFLGGGPGRHRHFGGPFGGPGRGGPLFGGLAAAAKYLDLTDAQLHERLESGKSLAQIAADQKKDLDGLKSAIKDGAKTELDAAVRDKRITQAQEDRILSDLNSRIDDIVNRSGDRGGRRGWHHGPSPDDPPSGSGAAPGGVPAAPPTGSAA
jgi:hypothetical protein